MPRYIDADALTKCIEKKFDAHYGNTCYQFINDFFRCVHRLIRKAPTIDAVEVVRCKDCKHWLKDVASCTDFVGRCAYANYMIGATGYCIYGERRGEA